MLIDIWSDIACPFCYIGKRRLEAAIKQLPKPPEFTIRWHAYQLDPTRPRETTQTIMEVLAQKYGQSVAWALQANQRVGAMAADLGLSFDFAQLKPTNTFDAHCLIKLSATLGKADAAKEALFLAYFCQGLNVADHATLSGIGVAIGLDTTVLNQVLLGSDFSDEVAEDIAAAQELGISGVPFFLFDEKHAISGAQEVSVFLAALSGKY